MWSIESLQRSSFLCIREVTEVCSVQSPVCWLTSLCQVVPSCQIFTEDKRRLYWSVLTSQCPLIHPLCQLVKLVKLVWPAPDKIRSEVPPGLPLVCYFALKHFRLTVVGCQVVKFVIIKCFISNLSILIKASAQ